MRDTAGAPVVSLAVLAHLRTLETRDDPSARYREKLELIRGVYRRSYGRQDILDLFHFIDWTMTLPEALEQRLWEAVQTFEEVKKVRYISSVERIGMKRG